MQTVPNAKLYRSYADLAAAQVEGEDYRVVVVPRATSRAAIVAPHGGSIEAHTSSIARQIAGTDLNLYLLEGTRPAGNYKALHLTSHRFDEPRCLMLVSTCDQVLTIHGCGLKGSRLLLGGLDEVLKKRLHDAFMKAGLESELTGHSFPAAEPRNICNMGATGAGVQIELTMTLRQSATQTGALATIVRSVLGAA
jgi:phage replication-related protein YjqB (UPF0714/DUF867 family)